MPVPKDFTWRNAETAMIDAIRGNDDLDALLWGIAYHTDPRDADDLTYTIDRGRSKPFTRITSLMEHAIAFLDHHLPGADLTIRHEGQSSAWVEITLVSDRGKIMSRHEGRLFDLAFLITKAMVCVQAELERQNSPRPETCESVVP